MDCRPPARRGNGDGPSRKRRPSRRAQNLRRPLRIYLAPIRKLHFLSLGRSRPATPESTPRPDHLHHSSSHQFRRPQNPPPPPATNMIPLCPLPPIPTPTQPATQPQTKTMAQSIVQPASPA